MKKDFSAAVTDKVYGHIADVTAEPEQEDLLKPRKRDKEPTAEEIQAAREQGRTQGRKGCKALRVNMAFSPEVHDYIRIMSKVRGESITQFTEFVFRQSMEENADLYSKAKAFQELF